MKRINRRGFLKSSGVWVVSGLALPWLVKRAAPPRPAAPAVADYQLQTPHQVLQMDVSASTYSTRFSQLTSQGYRPIWLQGSTNGAGAATFSAIWVRDGAGPWFEWLNMTAADYQTNFTNYAAQGYRPISVSGYQNSEVNQFAAVWLHDPSVGYSGIHNATNAEYQTFVNNAIAAGEWPQVVDGYAVGSSPSASDDYISIWAHLPVTAAEARHGLTSAGYQSFFNTYAALGYHVTCVSAYEINGTTYFAAMMVKDSVNDWYGYHNYLPADLYTQAVSRVQSDYQPIVIEGYDTGSTRNFAGVWIKKARSWTATGAANPDLVSFDNAVQSFMQARNIPCGSLAVTKDSRLVYARGYRWDGYNVDPVKPDSVFRIASLTKPLTSMAVMRLVQEHTLHLTDHLTSLLSLPAPLDPRMNDITLLELLQHLGGWNRDTSGFDPMFADQTIAAALSVSLPISKQNIITYMTTQRMLDFTPGTLYDYSNYGYLLLGRIIEAVTGVPYATHMQNAVFTPLGISRIVQGASEFEYRKPGEVPYFVTDPSLSANMRHAGAPVNAMVPYGNFNIENMDSHGAFLASAVDLVRFTTAFDATGLYPVLTKSTIDKIFAVPSVGVSPDGSWYGCGWLVRPAGSGLNTWHNGSLPGTSTLMVRRSDGLDWAVLFDQRDDPSGLDYGDIDPALHTAADAVTHWPKGDLFPNYGLPSRYEHRTYLPITRK
jgi:CubicO group peptidase (beta-lactamase class C family)